MKIHPVEHPVAPGYPDKYAEESKQALVAAQPRRWIAAPLAAGLAATVALGLSGCGDAFVTDGVPVMTPSGAETCTDYVVMGDVTTVPVVESGTVIPLFEFGEGTGSIGCVAIAAPVFFSEEEAFAILQAAFAEMGAMLEVNDKTQQAKLPMTSLSPGVNPDEYKIRTKKGELTPDGLLSGLPVEFVSATDVEAWEGDNGIHSTVVSFPVKQTAKTLAENNPGLAVFYDPMVKVYYQESFDEMAGEYGWLKTEAEAHAEAERLLRQQAQAFIEWMNTEGTH